MSGEDERLLARMADLERLTSRNKTASFTRFLDVRQASLVRTRFRPSPFVTLDFWGGYEESERTVAGLFPDFVEPSPSDYPIAVLRLDGTGNAGHRQILGSVLSLGVERAVIGDILPFENFAYLYCEEKIGAYLRTNLERVGRETVKISECDPQSVCIPERPFHLVEGTVASMRLDCVLSMVTGESRAKVAAYIKGGLANINWEPTEDPARPLAEGDVFSLRHFGRAEIASVGGKTKKDRLHLVVKQYI